MRRELQDIELLYEQLHSHVAEGKKTHHGGPCIPAVRRLFVDTKGEFFPCERVSEEDSEMCIGSLDSGFDFDKMSFLLNHGKMIKEKCLGCDIEIHNDKSRKFRTESIGFACSRRVLDICDNGIREYI